MLRVQHNMRLLVPLGHRWTHPGLITHVLVLVAYCGIPPHCTTNNRHSKLHHFNNVAMIDPFTLLTGITGPR